MGKTFSTEVDDKGLLSRYQTIRQAGIKLNSRMAKKCFQTKAIEKAGELLGMLDGKRFVFEDKSEMGVLTDFAIHERYSNKSIIDRCIEEKFWENETEKEILEAFRSSYTSLFKIVDILRKDRLLQLRDLLNQDEIIQLTDIGFSQTASPKTLIFTRIARFQDFNMTTGVAFVFPARLETEMVMTYKSALNHLYFRTESIQRFIHFFLYHKETGMIVEFR